MQRRFEGCIEDLIALLAETVWLHTPPKQIEAEIEVSRIVGVIAEERHRRGAKPIGRCLGAQDRTADGVSKLGERVSKNLRVERFLGLEVEIESGRSVASRSRYRPQGGAVQAIGLEDLPRGVQDEPALQVAHRLLPAGSLLVRH